MRSITMGPYATVVWRGRSVGLSVGHRNGRVSRENGWTDRDAAWHVGWGGPLWPRIRFGSGSPPGEGAILGANMGHSIDSNGDFAAYLCESAWTLGAAVWAGGWGRPRRCCIRRGSTWCKGKGRFWGFCFPIFTMAKAYSRASRADMPNVYDLCAKNWQHFRSADVSLESSFRWLFGDVFISKITAGVFEKFAIK